MLTAARKPVYSAQTPVRKRKPSARDGYAVANANV